MLLRQSLIDSKNWLTTPTGRSDGGLGYSVFSCTRLESVSYVVTLTRLRNCVMVCYSLGALQSGDSQAFGLHCTSLHDAARIHIVGRLCCGA
jgi:hypothetical protein